MRIWAAVIVFAAACSFGQQAATPAKDPGPFLGGYANQPQENGAKGKQPPTPAGPAPHFADGRPDFGGDGAWYPGFGGNIAEERWKGVRSADKHVDVPFLAAALSIFNQRVESNSKGDPEARCLPVGVPRYMFDPYPFEIVQTRDQVIFVFEGDNYLWRVVPLAATAAPKHPSKVRSTWLGDSIGHYAGNTLVVDVVGFNGKAWLDQAGHPQTERAHLIERYIRTDSNTLKYEVTIDDPGAYSKPWTTSNTVRWRPGFQLMESICQEDEKDSRHMIGNAPGAAK
ncbi:MAG: hypothetical protein JO062_03125 [Bryobacterales bacterium]|nr:hypothetical protein [Bryobacterales bacterium]